MSREHRVVDNRTFLLGLDYLYREAVRRHESDGLLRCARRIAAALNVAPADVPIEGYYGEDELLTEYFRLIRALQGVNENFTSKVEPLPEFRRLLDVMSSPIYGSPQFNGKLLPVGCDSLSEALDRTRPAWSVLSLTAAAHTVASQTDDISLVGLAALAQDAVVLTALRESVVLYADEEFGAMPPPDPKYVWQVDKEIAEQAQRFINTFDALFGESLPSSEPGQVETYWYACEANDILGRCVRLGYDDTVSPLLHYHWGIYRERNGIFGVQEFWHREVWTTTRYWSAVHYGGRHPGL